MKVFAFKSTNANIGKFDIDRLDDIAAEFEKFARSNQLRPYDYLECSGRIWTLVPGPNGLELQEGKVKHSQATGDTGAAPSSCGQTAIIIRYRNGYRLGAATIAFGNSVKIIGLIFGTVGMVNAISAASMASGDTVTHVLFSGLLGGLKEYLLFLILGVLISAIGQILRSTLDTAVHTSPFLNEQQKSEAMQITASQNQGT